MIDYTICRCVEGGSCTQHVMHVMQFQVKEWYLDHQVNNYTPCQFVEDESCAQHVKDLMQSLTMEWCHAKVLRHSPERVLYLIKQLQHDERSKNNRVVLSGERLFL